MQTYDLIVIGSGPGGQRAAIQGAKAGKRVAIIERQTSVGGVCINLGTIPSKTMREAVLHLSDFYEQTFYGSNHPPKEKVAMADLNFRVQHVIDNEVAVIQDQLRRNGIDLIYGPGAFTDPHHVRVELSTGNADFEAQYVVIATGTKPAANPKVPVNGRTIIDSDQVLTMPQIPKTMIVVGGGVIGAEYACIFGTLGVRVIVVEMRPRLLEFADNEMVEALTYHMRDHRATLRLNEEVESVEELPDGKVAANLVSKKRIIADALLYAVGRQGNVDALNLPAAGLQADGRGRIKVDADFRTAQPHIFAVGDVIGFPSLASVSMEQGRIAAGRAFGLDVHSDPAGYPYGIYTIPQISFIGKTEEQLTHEDVPYEVGVAYYREIARGQITGHTDGRLKLLFHRETLELLGVHIFGEDAAELLHIGQAVFLLKGKINYFVNTVFNYPTLAECYKAAAFNGLNRLG
jgi:NAD(P) transhydrogenase